MLDRILDHLFTPSGLIVAGAFIIAFFYILDAVEIPWAICKTIVGVIRELFFRPRR